MSGSTPHVLEADEDMHRKVQDLGAILELSKAMTAERDLDRLLGLIIQEATRLIQADRGSLFLVDDEKKELYSRIAEKSEIKEIRFPRSKGIAGHVATTGEVVNIRDAYRDPRFNPEVDRKTGFRTSTILCAPLQTLEGRIIGAIQILNKRAGAFTAYDEALLLALGSHAAVALDNARLMQHYLEKQRLQQALRIAREIQQSLLPKAPPELPGFELAGWTLPCDETGGDYYDYMEMENGKLGFVVADVVGHGVGAAILTAATRAFLRASLLSESDPGRILERVNNLLSRDMEDGRFVTLFLGVLDPQRSCFVYSSAGHDPPILLCHGGKKILDLDSTGLPLGIISDTDFPAEGPLSLEPDDLLLLMTDGLWEAQNRTEEAWGRDRMLRSLLSHKDQSLAQVIQNVYGDSRRFCGEAPQRDDITLVGLRRKR